VQRFIMPEAMRRHHEPTTSLRSSYTSGELSEMLVASPFPQHTLSRGPVWMLAHAKKL
jgi:hypothetical protein